ncbi:sigma-54-dependent transcriptional regulator [Steroidobacter cummioxidans]|uniref:sigma-54-dependent transcriptional regulator n=1 Tax=Steroidobacter cummioxidans TaxID=1803913 RepID=UPI000E30D914|nr:sigma-54 dependent transcriptional regulator [Steroidobacter cummioxidans]
MTLDSSTAQDPACRIAFFIDDDPDVRAANAQTLELAGFDVRLFDGAEAALAQLDEHFPGVVISDLRMPDVDGRTLFQELRRRDPDIPVILITGHGDIHEAVELIHAGAYDFIAKPFPAERLVSSVHRALEQRSLVLDNRRLRDAARREDDELPLIGDSPVMVGLRASLRQLADADVDVLIEGETGVGKEVAARALHAWSKRRTRTFAVLNCAALPDGLLESELFGHEAAAFQGAVRRRIGRIEAAHSGTLFLDDIESMPLALQTRLLRVLEDRSVTPLGANVPRPIDFRVVAASKVDLGDLAARELFRSDLYFRLNVVRLRIPPLRERRADIVPLFGHFLTLAAQRFRRSPPAITRTIKARLFEHSWPGNARELRNFADRVVLKVPDAAEAEADSVESLPERVERYEASLIRDALRATDGDVRATLAKLAIPRKTFYDKIARHRIDLDSFRRG